MSRGVRRPPESGDTLYLGRVPGTVTTDRRRAARGTGAERYLVIGTVAGGIVFHPLIEERGLIVKDGRLVLAPEEET